MTDLDEALARFHLGDLEYAGGLANHGPMAAEALERLGHPSLIPAFADVYAPRLPPFEPGRPIPPEAQAPALGDVSRASDWVATFEARLAEGDWREVAAGAVAELLPGLFAGAGHGWLRTAHALRGLGQVDDALRRRELARGLAYWAARYQTLPGRPGTGSQPAGAGVEALADWPLVAGDEPRAGLFFEAVRRLDGLPEFAAAVERFARPRSDALDGFVSALCRGAAGLYLAHPERRVAYVHAVTIPSALRMLRPVLADEEACRAATYAFQAVAALHALFGAGSAEEAPDAEDAPDAEVARIGDDWAAIRYHAACSLEEHSIKMVEACWREDRIAPDPVLRRAAADAALRIDARGRPAAC